MSSEDNNQHLTREDVLEIASRKGDLSGANLSGLDLSETKLTGLKMESADLSSANLTRATLVATKMTEIGRASCRERV